MENQRIPPTQFAGQHEEPSGATRNSQQHHPIQAFRPNSFPPPHYNDVPASDQPVDFSSREGIRMDEQQRPTMVSQHPPATVAVGQQHQPRQPPPQQHHMHSMANNNRMHGDDGAPHHHHPHRDGPVFRHHHQSEAMDPPPPAPSFPPVHPIEPLLVELAPSRRCLHPAKQKVFASGSLKPSRKRIGQQQRCICQRCSSPCWVAKESIVFRCPTCRGVTPTTSTEPVPDVSYT